MNDRIFTFTKCGVDTIIAVTLNTSKKVRTAITNMVIHAGLKITFEKKSLIV